jgi:hypothetical protein
MGWDFAYRARVQAQIVFADIYINIGRGVYGYLVHGEVAPVGHGEGGAGDVLHTLLQATRIGEREEGG